MALLEIKDLTMVDEAQLTGLERSLYYNSDSLSQIQQFHLSLARRMGLESTYLNFADAGQDKLFQVDLNNGVKITAGPVGSYSKGQVGAMIHEQTLNYLLGQTMGKKFPVWDLSAIEELTSIMINGFDKHRLIVLFDKTTDEGFKPIAGVQACFNDSENIIAGITAFGGNKQSVLAPFQALKVSNPAGEPTFSFLKKHGSLSEKDVVVMSRLFRQDDATAGLLGVDTRDYSWVSMAALGVAIGMYFPENEITNYPEILVYDTHTPKIQGKLESNFGTHLITKPGQVRATESIMSGILKYHYGSSQIGGYQDEIITGYANFSQYLEKSIAFLQTRESYLPLLG